MNIQNKNIQERIERRKEIIRKYWEENREPFKKSKDVPYLPIVDSVEWKTFFVPILIERGAIPKDRLIIGKTYYGECRNACKAVWLGDVFEYKRYKFGYSFSEKINHFEDDDGFDLFVPIKELEDNEEVDCE